MVRSNIPNIVVGRIPLYLRELTEMAAEGKVITSSQELGQRLGISSAQIRKDLSQFGEFGKQGTGYNITFLAEQLRRILKVDRLWSVVLVGAGDLGHAVANYGGFIDRGFRITRVYDIDPSKIGQKIGTFTIQDVAAMVDDIQKERIKIAMLAVPASDAQSVTDMLVEAGIQAILCYAPVSLKIPDGVKIQYIDPVLRLQHMTFYVP
ncbi:MAG: REX family transcriptional regulator [Anaerolineae bacterium SM23_ 63]|nr:MAG: REX family transcriptional regulator [Anaerolineae bacterium SM23_ 63]HEY46257.1 redox-sensing transcriptional repressor Rex [Anaerolineae bacterium]